MERYVCVHAHFYQPPRESPWTGEIPRQEEAAPYHDWNEKITAECYGPFARARILAPDGTLAEQVNLYSRISFNFGPTLLAWLERKHPEIYQEVLTADRDSRRNFSGHGAAVAQAYNHMILPLANARDKRTQVIWAVRDFEHRFGRKPEGMWLPETAVDLETLAILAEQGVGFTILSPHQARRVRPLSGGPWQDGGNGALDPTRAYQVRLPAERILAVFFYDGPASHAVAFQYLLANGDTFCRRLLEISPPAPEAARFAHIATDGETYGHHHKFGEMGLAYALKCIGESGRARLSNYGEFLEKHPPAWEAEIAENTSWSCAHGLERWQSDCGCRTPRHPGWNQQWRAPLREALDWLRERLAPRFEEEASRFLRDPWAARDDYIALLLDPTRAGRERFFESHGVRSLTEAERAETVRMLECQRAAMFMYTSCGWFFDDPCERGTVQILQYAAHALELGGRRGEAGLEGKFLTHLEQVRSNDPAAGDARRIYETLILPERARAEGLRS